MPKTRESDQSALSAVYNPYIDIAKFLMSILVVMIHIHPCEGVKGFILYNVIARIADPVFFIITSYFFFRKMDNTEEMKCGYLLKYIKRTAILYAIALVIYSPRIIVNCLYSNPTFWGRALWLMKKIFLQGPYGALWFLTALLLAVPLTFFSTKYLGKKATLIISFILYLPAIADTSYHAVLSDWTPLKLFTELITGIFGWYANGLTFGFFFCSVGMVFASEKNDREKKIARDAICLLLSAAALFAEAFTLRSFNIASDYWAMFFLTPVSFFFMRILLEAPVMELKTGFIAMSKFLRNMSVIIYVFHIFFKDLLDVTAAYSCSLYIYPSFRFMLILSVTMLFAAVVVKLSHYRRFRFLKYLY